MGQSANELSLGEQNREFSSDVLILWSCSSSNLGATGGIKSTVKEEYCICAASTSECTEFLAPVIDEIALCGGLYRTRRAPHVVDEIARLGKKGSNVLKYGTGRTP